MASILRQIVAGPRARHPEAGLDLCYVTDNIIATSGPSATYPQVAYRNPLKDLVRFLDSKHGAEWAIWEFRAEGTGYPDSEVYGRVRHYPWPDHHPPPFALIPLIMASMRNWLKDSAAPPGRVVVVHCKAGKGRSGTVSCSYLISEEGWTAQDAMQRFTERRMRPGFGNGVSIPSQVRWISYVDRWTQHGKIYVEKPAEILEVHVWGLRDGVKIVIEGYVDEGKVIKKFHTFHRSEREIIRGKIRSDTGLTSAAMELIGRGASSKEASDGTESNPEQASAADELVGGDVVFRPSSRVVLPTSDINIDFERRNKTRYGGFTMVTSVAHVWFNTFFEGRGPEQNGDANGSGVFDIQWDAMDGIKGSSRKGIRAFDRLAVVWKAVQPDRKTSVVINEPAQGEEVEEKQPADWRGEEKGQSLPRLGLRPETHDSAAVSRASSVRSSPGGSTGGHGSEDELNGVQASGPDGEQDLDAYISSANADAIVPDAPMTDAPQPIEATAGEVGGLQGISTADLPGGKPEEELNDHKDHSLGHIKSSKNAESSS